MISYCPGAPQLEESLIGCRMQTLAACYDNLNSGLGWYQSDAGGVICRFGEALLISGTVNFGELFAFADMLGAHRIEWITEQAAAVFLPQGWTSRSYPVLSCTGGGAAGVSKIQTNIELRRCFEILCQSDAQFARTADDLFWLSDMTRRRNVHRAEGYLLEDCATACITAKGRHSAYLSSVAVLPAKRGKGLGLMLVQAIVNQTSLQGFDIYTAAQEKSFAAFYRQAGFSALPEFVTIAEKGNT